MGTPPAGVGRPGGGRSGTVRTERPSLRAGAEQESSRSRAGAEQEPGGSRVGDGAVCAAVARIARAIVPLGIAHGVHGVYASALRPLCVLPSVTLSGIKHLSLDSQRKVVIACTAPDAE